MYKDYVRGLRNNIKAIRKALSADVQLSFLEQLDYNFKRELLYFATGSKTYRRGFLGSKLDVDYRVASFLAECFDDVMYMYNEAEYSFKEITEMAKDYCSTAWKRGITTERYSIDSFDKNNILYLVLIVDRQEVYDFRVGDLKSAAYALIELVSFLGCEGYTEGKYQDEVEDYLLNVFKVVMTGGDCRPLIDNNQESRTLEKYIISMSSNRQSKELASRNSAKVIPYKKVI